MIIDQYEDVIKALNCDDFNCKSDVKFKDKDYLKQLAKIKSRENSLLKELDILKSNEDVISCLKENKRLEAKRIIKSLYKEGKIGQEQFNDVAS